MASARRHNVLACSEQLATPDADMTVPVAQFVLTSGARKHYAALPLQYSPRFMPVLCAHLS